jgi:putative addiction module component (TIGR02574 family)
MLEMPMARKEALLREVLRLSPEERADLAAELLANLESLPIAEADEIEREWGAEIERRARRVLAGESSGVPWEEVEHTIRRCLIKR